MLVEAGVISDEQLQAALAIQKTNHVKIVEALISLGFMDPRKFAAFLARQPGVSSIELLSYKVPKEIIDLVPKELARKHEVFPIDRLGRLLTLGMACPLDSRAINELEATTGLTVKPMLCSRNDIHAAINRNYPHGADEQDEPDTEEAPENGRIGPKSLVRLLQKLRALPALPETVQRIRKSMADKRVSVHEAAEILCTDPPVAARILSVANAAAYGFPSRVDNIELAVSLMGLRDTYNLVLSLDVVNMLDESRNFDYKAYWVNAMCCATMSRMIARKFETADERVAFTAGMMHSVGRVALLQVVPELYNTIAPDATGAELLSVEEELLGLTYPDAGYELALQWGFPKEITEAIHHHRRPEHASDAKALVATVGAAGATCTAGQMGAAECQQLARHWHDIFLQAGVARGSEAELAEAFGAFNDMHVRMAQSWDELASRGHV